MADSTQNEKQNYTEQYQQLIQSQQTLVLSTVTEQGKPHSSYAPFTRDAEGIFYIFVSELAVHTKNMLKNGSASILFIKSESETKNLFARERVVLDCEINEVQPQDECYYKRMLIMREKFGETVALLQSLPDFHLLALKAVEGKYIAGFGKAFSINTADWTLDINE